MTGLILATLGASLAGLGLLIIRNRQAQARGGEAIRIVTSKHLGAKRFLTIIEADGERLLLGLAGDNVTLLAHLGAEDAASTAPFALVQHGEPRA